MFLNYFKVLSKLYALGLKSYIIIWKSHSPLSPHVFLLLPEATTFEYFIWFYWCLYVNLSIIWLYCYFLIFGVGDSLDTVYWLSIWGRYKLRSLSTPPWQTLALDTHRCFPSHPLIIIMSYWGWVNNQYLPCHVSVNTIYSREMSAIMITLPFMQMLVLYFFQLIVVRVFYCIVCAAIILSFIVMTTKSFFLPPPTVYNPS